MKRGLGIIGAGEFGHFASQVLDRANGFWLVGVADVNDQAARAIAKRYGVPVYNDYRKLLRNPAAEIVMINTPNDLHEPMAIDALGAGKHVFCEKPLALSVEGVKRIYHHAEKAKRLVGADFVLRRNQLYDFVAKQRYGSLRAMTVDNQATESTIKAKWYWDLKRSGGWFATADIHFYDLFFYLGADTALKDIAAVEKIDAQTRRTRAITTHATTKNGQHLDVQHTFHAKRSQANATVTADFDHAHVIALGWVPTKLIVTTKGITTQMSLPTDRETEYHEMVRRGLERLVSAISAGQTQQQFEDPRPIIAAHELAYTAQIKAKKQ